MPVDWILFDNHYVVVLGSWTSCEIGFEKNCLAQKISFLNAAHDMEETNMLFAPIEIVETKMRHH